jgi:hypothetical protein
VVREAARDMFSEKVDFEWGIPLTAVCGSFKSSLQKKLEY